MKFTLIRYGAVALALAIVLLGVAAAVSTAADGSSSTSSFFGIQMRDNQGEQATLPLAGGAGIQTIRFNLRWDEVEPANTNPPTYNWGKYDTLIGNATAAGFSLIITVRDNPTWAATTACGPIDQVPPERFVTFLTEAVAIYSRPPYNVKLWELYNEPDNNHPEMPQQGGCWGQHAAEYAALLGKAHPAIKAADSESQLVLGGLAYDFFEGVDEGGIFNQYFLVDMLNSPDGTSFDIMNFHYYRAFHERWDQFGQDVIGKATHIRGELAKVGQTKPIMVTEIGHPSEGPAGDGQDYSDEASSRYVVQAYARGVAANLHSMVWFEMVDSSVEPRKYGLLKTDHTAKPAYLAYKTMTEQLFDGLPYLRDDSTTELEAYVFDAGDREKYVSWSAGTVTQTLSISADAVWIVDKFGNRRSIGDGAAADRDGSYNGSVTLDVGPDPVYVYPMLPADLRIRVYLPVTIRTAL